MSTNLWEQLLRQTTAASVGPAFESLLERKINLAAGIRSKASDSQNHLRDFLASEHKKDVTFPRVLSIADSDFLGGSFARHTKIWPLDDIDVYVPLDGYNLIYTSYGVTMPFTVLSDNVLRFQPVLTPRWTNGNFVSSRKLVEGFVSVLRRHYGEGTDVYPNGESVGVRLTYGETENAEGLGYDVVPCFSLIPNSTDEFRFYLIPDGNDGWIRTNPRLDSLISDKLQEFNSKLYRPVVKLIKFWNKEQLGAAFSSYYIELALSQEFLTRKANGQRLNSISEGLTIGFGALKKAYESDGLSSWVNNAPVVARPLLSINRIGTLARAAATASVAYRHESQGNASEALKNWASIFGENL